MTAQSEINPAEILVTARPGETTGLLQVGNHRFPCALGRTGLVGDKREGDGGTPLGSFPLRRILYRSDRLPAPSSTMPLAVISPDDGWCDAPDDPNYNRPVRLPYPASCETLWRTDHLYDLVVILGHNDSPPVPGRGSAIFFHLAKEKDGSLQPTEGCVALRLGDMRAVLSLCMPEMQMTIKPD